MHPDELTFTPEMHNVASYVTHPAQSRKAQRAALRQLTGMVAAANPYANGHEVDAAVRDLVRA